jgi:hypothetical protein
MLEPNNRRLLREALRPPPGYVLNRAIATSFSLDLMALLAIPVSFTFFQLKDHDGPPQVDPLALVEALRRYARKITVFCQMGQIHVPKHIQLLMGYLENSVCAVKAPRGGVFHPKVTVLRYVAPDRGDDKETLPPVVYRLLCSSRNLTFDRSWDTLLILNGVLARHRANAFARNHPLARFIRELPALAVNPIGHALSAEVESIADELLRVDFEIPDGFEDLEFCPLGLSWTSNWPIVKHRRTLAMAPFVNDGFVKRFSDKGVPLGLISCENSLDELSGESLNKLFDAWYMNTASDPIPVDSENEPAAVDADAKAGAGAEEERVELSPTVQLHGLHAKLFVSDDGWKSHVWTGSANATVAAFERNVEFMVHLTGKRSSCGIARFVQLTEGAGENAVRGDAGSRDDRNLGFADLLLKYRRDGPPVIDGVRKALDLMLDSARYALAGSRISARVEPCSEPLSAEFTPDRFRVTLSLPDPIELPIEVKIECYPLTLKESNALNVPTPIGSTLALFEPLSFEALTSFYAFRLTAVKDMVELSCGFVLNLPLIGAPADREGRLLLSLLRNREQLLKYLLMLLSDDEESARRLIDAFGSDKRNYHADGETGGFGLPLLEPLLQALDRQPAQLDQISHLITDLRKSPEGQKLVSDDFLSIWEPIWAARKKIR